MGPGGQEADAHTPLSACRGTRDSGNVTGRMTGTRALLAKSLEGGPGAMGASVWNEHGAGQWNTSPRLIAFSRQAPNHQRRAAWTSIYLMVGLSSWRVSWPGFLGMMPRFLPTRRVLAVGYPGGAKDGWLAPRSMIAPPAASYGSIYDLCTRSATGPRQRPRGITPWLRAAVRLCRHAPSLRPP